jgi:sugar (pentulose or hexulose) kinase
MGEKLYLGIDFGTSGARAIALTPTHQIQAETQIRFDSSPIDLAQHWRTTLFQLLHQIPSTDRQHI